MPSGVKDPPKAQVKVDIDRGSGRAKPLEKPTTPKVKDPLSVSGKPER